jgi:hypothetical protein
VDQSAVTTVIDEILAAAEDGERQSIEWGNVAHQQHLYVGLTAVCFGVVAGATGLSSGLHWITAAAGVLAGIAAGVQTFLRSEERALQHRHDAAQYGSLVLETGIVKARTSSPSEDEVMAFIQQLTEIRKKARAYGRMSPQEAGDSDASVRSP